MSARARPLKGVELLMPIQPSKLLVVLGAFPGARTLEEARGPTAEIRREVDLLHDRQP